MIDRLMTGISSILAVGVAIPIAVVFVESMSASLLKRSQKARPVTPPDFKILIPAHNEATMIGATLEGLLTQVDTAEQIVVVADNCTDETAAIARNHAVTVLERFDDQLRGKGYALDAGLQLMEDAPPDVVLMIDADCTVEANGVKRIVQTVAESGRPVQAVYLQRPPAEPSLKDLVSAFAFRVKNWVRPKGLHQLGQPVLLTGSGMAFPYHIIRSMPLASGNIVEDMQLGLDLALAGHAPLLEDRTIVWGELPAEEAAATTQRTRWEHGHLHTLLTQVPRLLVAAVKQRRFGLFALALEQAVPPLALLVLLWGSVGLLSILSSAVSSIWIPTFITGISGFLLLAGIVVAWVGFGRDTIPFSKLVAVPLYIAWKIPLYISFLFKRQTAWVRTSRDGVDAAD